MGDFVDRAIEGVLIRVRRSRESGQLPNELQRRRANFIIRRGRRKIMQGLNVSTHAPTIDNQLSTINLFCDADVFWFGEEAQCLLAAFAADAAGFHAAEPRCASALFTSTDDKLNGATRFLLGTKPEVQLLSIVQFDLSWNAQHSLFSF